MIIRNFFTFEDKKKVLEPVIDATSEKSDVIDTAEVKSPNLFQSTYKKFLKHLDSKSEVNEEDDFFGPHNIPTLERLYIKGKGGNGTVWSGTCNGEKVAIKDIQFDASSFKSYLQEVKVMECLAKDKNKDHASNIVEYLGYSKTSDTLSIIMGYVPIPLTRIAYGIKPFDPQRCWDIMEGVVKGIQYLHNVGYIHCDIKCDNILLEENYEVKVCDFGLARPIKSKLTYRGTPFWMAPEVADTTDIGNSPASDIYSLGVLFWAMSARREPYLSTKEIMQGKIEPIPKGSIDKVKILINWCRIYNRNKRPTTNELAQEMSSSLDEISEKLKLISLKFKN